MKSSIKEIMNSKYDENINYSKIINNIENRKDKNIMKFLKPCSIVLASCLVLVVSVKVINTIGVKSSYEMAYDSAATYDNDVAYAEEAIYSNSVNTYGFRGTNEVQEAKIIHTANISFETKNYDESNKALIDLVNKYNGYVISSDVWSNEYEGTTYRNGSYTVRIPVDQYELFMNETGGIGSVNNISSNQEDITDDYIDVETRIATLKAQEERLVELLAQAKDLSDIISIEDKLTEVRYNIESYQSTMNYYTKVTDYATIYIYISEVVNYSNNNKIIKAINNTIDNFVEVLEDIAVFVIYALPFVLAILIIVIIVIVIKKRKKR